MEPTQTSDIIIQQETIEPSLNWADLLIIAETYFVTDTPPSENTQRILSDYGGTKEDNKLIIK